MEPYVGEIRMFGGDYAPEGWMLCDGRTLPIAQYDLLFALLGTTYGGDGQTTFALPDLRGRAPMHHSTNYPLGARGGSETVSLVHEHLAMHTHGAKVKSGNGNSSAPAAHYWAGNSDFQCYDTEVPNAQFAGGAIGPAGGNQPHENMMPFIAMSFIIAYVGLYPSPN